MCVSSAAVLLVYSAALDAWQGRTEQLALLEAESLGWGCSGRNGEADQSRAAADHAALEKTNCGVDDVPGPFGELSLAGANTAARG